MPPPEPPPDESRWQLHLRGLEVRRRWRAVCDDALARQEARLRAVAEPVAVPRPAPTP